MWMLVDVCAYGRIQMLMDRCGWMDVDGWMQMWMDAAEDVDGWLDMQMGGWMEQDVDGWRQMWID